MSSIIGSLVSGIYVDETQVRIVSNSNNAISLQTSSAAINFGGYQLANIGSIGANLNMDSNKIVNLANATLATDALNMQTADSRYLAVSTHLNSIEAPTGDITFNNYKLTNLAPGTASTDAVNLGQDLRNHWLFGYLSADITNDLTTSYVVKFPSTYGPGVLSPAITNNVQYSPSSGLFTLAIGKYQIAVNTELSYISGVNAPAQVSIIASTDGTVKSFTSNRAPALSTKQLTSYSFIYNCTASQDISLTMTLDTNKTESIGSNTNMHIRRLF